MSALKPKDLYHNTPGEWKSYGLTFSLENILEKFSSNEVKRETLLELWEHLWIIQNWESIRDFHKKLKNMQNEKNYQLIFAIVDGFLKEKKGKNPSFIAIDGISSRNPKEVLEIALFRLLLAGKLRYERQIRDDHGDFGWWLERSGRELLNRSEKQFPFGWIAWIIWDTRSRIGDIFSSWAKERDSQTHELLKKTKKTREYKKAA